MKSLFRKIPLYRNLHHLMLKHHTDELEKKLTSLEGHHTIDGEQYSLHIARLFDYHELKYFYEFELDEVYKKHGNSFTFKNFMQPTYIHLALYSEHYVAATSSIKIRGLKLIEFGTFIGKRFRKKGLSTWILTTLEDFSRKHNLKFYMVINRFNESSLLLAKKLGYEKYKIESDMVYVKKNENAKKAIFP